MSILGFGYGSLLDTRDNLMLCHSYASIPRKTACDYIVVASNSLQLFHNRHFVWMFVSDTVHLQVTLNSLQFPFRGHSFLFLQLHELICFSFLLKMFLLTSIIIIITIIISYVVLNIIISIIIFARYCLAIFTVAIVINLTLLLLPSLLASLIS